MFIESTKTLYFDGDEICSLEIIDRNLHVTNMRHTSLIPMQLFITKYLKRKDFTKLAVMEDDSLVYPLRFSDIIVLTKHGFKYTKTK